MVVVPAGEFMMGSPNDEEERLTYESPQHLVKIPSPFAVGRFAVTFDEWDACVAEGHCGGASLSRGYDEGWGRGRRPVINVSWNDANAYVAWLSNKTGKIYRLLSEAEREYVTRAGTTTPFWWGKSNSADQAQYNSLSSYGGGKTRARIANKTLPVDSFAPNPWGLYQVHGNVTEWVEDCWHENYVGAPTDGSAWSPETVAFASCAAAGGRFFPGIFVRRHVFTRSLTVAQPRKGIPRRPWMASGWPGRSNLRNQVE